MVAGMLDSLMLSRGQLEDLQACSFRQLGSNRFGVARLRCIEDSHSSTRSAGLLPTEGLQFLLQSTLQGDLWPT
eukprot:s15801_g1.t1